MKHGPEDSEGRPEKRHSSAEQEYEDELEAGPPFCNDPLCPCGDPSVWDGICDDDFHPFVTVPQSLPEGPEIDRIPLLIATRQGLILVGHLSTSARGH